MILQEIIDWLICNTVLKVVSLTQCLWWSALGWNSLYCKFYPRRVSESEINESLGKVSVSTTLNESWKVSVSKNPKLQSGESLGLDRFENLQSQKSLSLDNFHWIVSEITKFRKTNFKGGLWHLYSSLNLGWWLILTLFNIIMTPSLTHIIWPILSQNNISFVNCNTFVVYFWGCGRVQNYFGVSSYRLMTEFCSISAYHVVLSLWWVVVWCSQGLLCLNPTTFMVILLLGMWLLLGCDNSNTDNYILTTVTLVQEHTPLIL